MEDNNVIEISTSIANTIEVEISSDRMIAYIKLDKDKDKDEEVMLTKDIIKNSILEALQQNNVVYGIKENIIEKLSERPIYGIKLDIARGLEPLKGADGAYIPLVKKDSEYQPTYSEDGIIDYKNLDYFQMVKKGQTLCTIIKEAKGTEGIDVCGETVPALSGKPPFIPMGKNTLLNEDETELFASCDGLVKYIGTKIDISNVLKIDSNVNQLTGNINFTGDVIIEGDVCDGFSVKATGNINIKGVVEDAHVEAGGNLQISRGISGNQRGFISVANNLISQYIETANIEVGGNIRADYIFDSKIICKGNIELLGTKQIIIGGDIKLNGQLTAKYIGNENERITRIEILGKEIVDIEEINKLKKESQELLKSMESIIEVSKLYDISKKSNENSFAPNKLEVLKQQIDLLKKKIDSISRQIQNLEESKIIEYVGFVECRGKIYQGVKIFCNDQKYQFDTNSIDHCRIYWNGQELVFGTL